MATEPLVVVFSSLEGSAAIEAASHSRAALHAGLKLLGQSGVPVVLASSGTRAEIELVREDLGLADPFIAENGAAVFVPRGYFPFPLPASGMRAGYHTFELSIAHDAVVRALKRAAGQARASVLGFSDMSISEVARECGFTLLRARLAKLREYDEPFRVMDSDAATRTRLLKTLTSAGLQVWSSGRFDHVVGRADLSACVGLLRSLYGRQRQVITVGLGSSLADLDLLRRVDVPVSVPGVAPKAAAALARSVPGIRVTHRSGPDGWLEAVEGIVRTRDEQAAISRSDPPAPAHPGS